jgi:hypothetical protein
MDLNYDEIRRIDDKVKVCFITATYETNYEGLGNSERGTGDHRNEETPSLQHYCALRKDMFLKKANFKCRPCK